MVKRVYDDGVILKVTIERDGELMQKPVYITDSGHYIVRFRNRTQVVDDLVNKYFLNKEKSINIEIEKIDDFLKKTSDAQIRANAKYDKRYTKGIYLKLNKKTDADIIDHLRQVDKVQTYIKKLIRDDMK